MIFLAALLAIATGWGLFVFAILSGAPLWAAMGVVLLHLAALAALVWYPGPTRCHDAMRGVSVWRERAMFCKGDPPAWEIVHDRSSGRIVLEYTPEALIDRTHIDHATSAMAQQLHDTARQIHGHDSRN